MIIYHYHSEYNHFVGQDDADSSPLEPGKYLIPANATKIAPPECENGQIQIFDGTFWSVIEDKRGIYYTTEERSDIIINDNPSEAPQDCTREVPPDVEENQYLTWDDGWIINDIVPAEPLTPEQKLANAGLTVEELKGLLGISTT